jgi:hypothetical protein
VGEVEAEHRARELLVVRNELLRYLQLACEGISVLTMRSIGPIGMVRRARATARVPSRRLVGVVRRALRGVRAGHGWRRRRTRV